MLTDIPLLQNVRVAAPCSASWDEMAEVDHDRVRFCEGCRKRVYNLSALGQAEAEGLLRTHEGRLCVRYYRRHDGTILTADCPVGLRAARQMILTRARVSVGMCLVLCVALAAQRTLSKPAPVVPEPTPVVVMGGIAAPQPKPEPHEQHWTMGMVAAPVMGKLPSLSPRGPGATSLSPREEIGAVEMGEPASDPKRHID